MDGTQSKEILQNPINSILDYCFYIFYRIVLGNIYLLMTIILILISFLMEAKLMNDFERTLVKSFNESFEESGTKAFAYRLKQSRFLPQFIDVIVDSANPDLYLGVECKSISVEKGASALYLSQHLTTDKKGLHQIERISEFLRQTGRTGFLAVELRMGAGQSRQAFMIPWDLVEKKFRDKGIKIPVEQIKTHGELKRRNKNYQCASLFEPLRKTRLDSIIKRSTETHRL